MFITQAPLLFEGHDVKFVKDIECIRFVDGLAFFVETNFA